MTDGWFAQNVFTLQIIITQHMHLQTRGDTSHWLTEYKRLEQKTRRQLHAKDKEIKRLRNVIVQLESENYENLKQLLKDMKYQVDLVSKWIDHKSGTLTTESALVRMALSRHGKVDDIFSGSSESSSNQSTLDRPQKSQNRRRDRGAMLCHSPLNMPLSESTVKDDTKQETSPLIEGGSHDYAVTALQHFTVNVSNPPTAADSDTSDITRPLQATQAVVTVPTAPTSEFGITGAYLSQLMQQDHREESSVSPNDALAFYDITSTLLDVQPASVTEPTHDTVTNMVAAAASKDAVAVRTSDGSHTPSTVKSTAGTPNTISPTPSSQDGSKTPYSSKTFLYGRALSPRSYHQSDESSTDFKAVFRKIRGRDPPTK